LTLLEHIAATDVGRRIGALADAASGGLRRAAAALVAARPLRVVVITGFYLPAADPPSAETDGPLGAAQIAAAVEALGGTAVLITDEPCAAVVQAAAAAFEVEGPIMASPVDADDFSDWLDDSLPRLADVTHAVSIERPGPSPSGVPRNMRGADISASTAPLHRLYEQCPGRHIAVGDGGNEIGMGAVPPAVIERHVDHGALIRCVTGCDDLIVAGTSNWGGHALVAALTLLQPAVPSLARVLDLGLCRAALTDMCAAGATDGKTLQATATIDGLDWVRYAAVAAQLNEVALSARARA
jgi:hypothetical protein